MDEMVFVPEGLRDSAHGFDPTSVNLIKASAQRMYFVPEGQHDSSHSTRYRLLMAGLARSAWESVHRGTVP
jgi:hypothetical protein